MFVRSARFYDAIYSWKDYAGEARRLEAMIRARKPDARTLLDVACGTGRHLELLRDSFDVEGVELEQHMLEIARARLPGITVHPGDMLEFDLGRRFDAVTCLFAAIAYTLTRENLRVAIGNLARHVEPGGVVAVEPYVFPERWEEGRIRAEFVDEPDLKIARLNVARPLTDPMGVEFHHLVATRNGVEHFTEEHLVGMFSREDFQAAFADAGLEAELDDEGLMGRGLFLAVAPA